MPFFPPSLLRKKNRLCIATGANAAHYANLKVLVGSWWANMRETPLCVCDYGLAEPQRAALAAFPGLVLLKAPGQIGHPWLGKAMLGRFLAPMSWDIVMWIDADALFATPMPSIPPLLEGYDMLIDAHVQAVGEIVHECNRVPLGLRKDDAYFSAGWWIARKGPFFDSYERLCRLVQGKGNLWECDAFVAAIYLEKLKLRTVNGGVWHCRGKTSLHTCRVQGLVPSHEGLPIYVVHANDGYSVRADGRRIFARPELGAIQDHYEEIYRQTADTLAKA